MKNIFKKMPVALASALIAANGLLVADMDSRVTALEQQMNDVRTKTANCCYGARTCSSLPTTKERGWFATADLLYWRLYGAGLDFAYTDSRPGGLPINGDMRKVTNDWDWGFRIGIGYFSKCSCDGWDVYFNYTWFETEDTHYSNSGPNSTIYPNKIYPNNPLITTVSTSSGKYEFNYRVFDFELGRGFYLSKCFAMRPFMGVRGAGINQKMTFTYAGGDLNNDKIHIHDKNDFRGAGLRAGTDLSYALGCGFGILGKASMALLAGSHDVKYKANKSEIPASNIRVDADIRRFVPNIQFFLGVSYDKNINKNCNHIAVSLGYETQYWWRMNQTITFDNVSANAGGPNGSNGPNNFQRETEDIGIHGVTLDVRFDF